MLAVPFGELSKAIERLDVAPPDQEMRKRVEDQRREPIARILDHRHAASCALRLDLERDARGSQRSCLRLQL